MVHGCCPCLARAQIVRIAVQNLPTIQVASSRRSIRDHTILNPASHGNCLVRHFDCPSAPKRKWRTARMKTFIMAVASAKCSSASVCTRRHDESQADPDSSALKTSGYTTVTLPPPSGRGKVRRPNSRGTEPTTALFDSVDAPASPTPATFPFAWITNRIRTEPASDALLASPSSYQS